jgi:hypothetical protein
VGFLIVVLVILGALITFYGMMGFIGHTLGWLGLVVVVLGLSLLFVAQRLSKRRADKSSG